MGNSNTGEQLSDKDSCNSDNSEDSDEVLENNYLECPSYTLMQAQELPELTQKQITWLLVQFKTKGEPLTEEVEGYLKIFKKNRYGLKESRWILFTSIALYVVESGNFTQLTHRVLIQEIKFLGFSLDNKSFGIRENETNHIFYLDQSINAVNATKTLNYLLTEDFLFIRIAENAKELMKEMKKNIEIEEPDMDTFLKFKEKFGKKWEYLITTVSLYELRPKPIKMKLLLSNFSAYLSDLNGQLYNVVRIKNIIGCFLKENHLEFVIKCKNGGIAFVHDQAYAILREICEIKKSEKGKAIAIKVVDQNFQFNRMPKM